MIFPISSALLDTCVLSVLIKEDAYGYILTQALKDTLEVSESTLYPVLRRLQKEGYLETYDSPFQGRNRRYYRATEKGRQLFEKYKIEWNAYKSRIDGLILGGGEHE